MYVYDVFDVYDVLEGLYVYSEYRTEDNSRQICNNTLVTPIYASTDTQSTYLFRECPG